MEWLQRIDFERRIWVLLPIVLWALLGGIAYVVLIRPDFKYYETLVTQVAQLQQTLDWQRQRQVSLISHCQQLKTMIESLQLKTHRFPRSKELPDFMQMMANLVTASDLVLTQFTPITTTNRDLNMNTRPFNIEMIGTYPHFILFLDRLSKISSFVGIKRLLLTPLTDPKSKLKIQLVIQTLIKPITLNTKAFELYCIQSDSARRAYRTSFIANSQRRRTLITQKAPLEQYPVSQMKFVGVMQAQSRIAALIKLPNDNVFPIRLGQRLGNSKGIVHRISKQILQVLDSTQGIISLPFDKKG